MNLLLDTHAFLWWLLKDPRLSSVALEALTNRSNALYLSSASSFEIAAKASAGKLRLPLDVQAFMTTGMEVGAVKEIPVTFPHTYRMARLPMIHRDPFDRLLVATALEEGLTSLTTDSNIRKYPVATLW